MHHVSDVVTGAIMGIGALLIAVTASRLFDRLADRSEHRFLLRDRLLASPWSPAPTSGTGMTTVAVVAHQKKSLGGGLDGLRSLLAHEGSSRSGTRCRRARAPASRDAIEKAPTSCSCGAATAWFSAASMPWPARA
jgi:hypothetical protein